MSTPNCQPALPGRVSHLCERCHRVLVLLRIVLVLVLTVIPVVAPVVAGASPREPKPKAGPKGSVPAEVWQAIEERRASRPSRSAPDPAAVLATPAKPVVPAPPPPPPPPPAPALLPTKTPNGAPVYFAGVAGLQLRLPGGVQAVGFHESGSRGALPLHPVGRPKHNDNMGRLREAPVSLEGGTTYSIMSSRWRGGGPTTAVDIAMPHGWPVQSPVTGTVEVVQGYRLYGRMHDYFVQIVPDARPDLRVKLLHLDTVHVAPGHRVVEGETIIAGTSRLLPVNSQVDRYAGVRGPHVHVEIVPGR
jgi:murein DD-endopeptidase MepM/ murein hydrolase activator NlpD